MQTIGKPVGLLLLAFCYKATVSAIQRVVFSLTETGAEIFNFASSSFR